MSVSNLYCARSDVTKRMPIGSVSSSSGIVASSDTGANTFTYDGHGLETGDPVIVRAVEGGSLPAPLVNNATYYAIRVSNALFALSATPLGAAIDITTAAVSMVIAREPDFDSTIEFYSRWADTFLPGHAVPLGVTEPVHPLVKGLVADLVAKRELTEIGKDSAAMTAAEVEAGAQLQRFAAGLPLRGAPVTASANLAVTNNIASTGDPRGWGSSSLP